MDLIKENGSMDRLVDMASRNYKTAICTKDCLRIAKEKVWEFIYMTREIISLLDNGKMVKL